MVPLRAQWSTDIMNSRNQIIFYYGIFSDSEI